MRGRLLIAFLLCSACGGYVGCGSKPAAPEKKVLAGVGDKQLFEEDVKALVPVGLSHEDSLLFVSRYVQNWVEECLFIDEAESDSRINLDEIEERVEEYRRTLIYYAHLGNVIASGMDTVVTDAQLRQFYEENKANFELKDNILKAQYVIAPGTAKKSDKAKKRFFAGDDEEGFLAEFCRESAYRCQMDDTSWISFDDLAKVIPVDRTQSPETFLRNKKAFEISDTGLVYWVKITDYKIKESISPFEFVRDEIKLILLNRRKKEFLVAYRKKLFDGAIENKTVELNYP